MNRKKKSMRKRILAWMLAAGMVVSGCSVNGLGVVSVAAAESGTFGTKNKVSYSIENQTLTITGEGEITGYSNKGNDKAPWLDEMDSITTIEIKNGITSIGSNVFNVAYDTNANTSKPAMSASKENKSVTKVVLPGTLTKIESKAFANLKELKTVQGTKSSISIAKLSKDAFDNFDSITWIEPTTPTPVPTKDPAVIKQDPDIGAVSCEETVAPTKTYDQVKLTRANETVPGKLALKETDFNKSGSNQYDYIFTPADESKYSEVTGKVWINVEKDTLESIGIDGTLTKGTYKYGEKFEINGMKVTAKFKSKNSKDVTKYVKASELNIGTTSVDISYTFDSVTVKKTFTGFKVEKGDIPDGVPKDTEVANKIKTVSAAASTVLGTGSKWQFASSDLSKTIPAGGSLDVTATYKGSDAANYNTKTATVKISRGACVEDKTKILYTGTGEKAPTCTTAGVGHTACSECGDTMTTNIPVKALGHKIEAVAAKSATCTEKGNDAYYKCSNCGKTYADSAGKTETTVKTYDALGHKYDGQTPTYSWSSDNKTCTASIKCKVCNATVTEKSNSTCNPLQQATCQNEGEAMYMAEFKNTAFSVQFQYGKIAKTSHSLKKIDRVEATETQEGSIEYYECTICKKKFFDSTGRSEITNVSDIIIPAKGVTPTTKPSETAKPSQTPKPSDSTKPTPKPNGTNVRDTSGVVYKVVNSDSKNPTVEYKASTAVVGGNVKIKDTVKVLGVTYKVTSIASNAFKNNNKVTSVTLGKNVTSIGSSAFQKCSKLKTISLGKNVKKIGKNAFNNCKSLKTITIKSAKLSIADVKKGAFSGIAKKVTIKVPKDCYSVYKALLRSKGLSKKVKFKKKR